MQEWATGIVEDPQVQAQLLADARAGKLHPSVLTVLMTYAHGRPNLRDVPEPETSITIELNIPKPPGVIHTDSTGEHRHCLLRGASDPSPLNRQPSRARLETEPFNYKQRVPQRRMSKSLDERTVKQQAKACCFTVRSPGQRH